MRNILLVIKHEILSMLGKRSFWTTTFLLPALIMLLNLGTQFATETIFESIEAEVAQQGASQIVGYVDKAGLITQVPDEVKDTLRSFEDEDAALAALEAGDIALYSVIPADFVESGQVTVVDNSISFSSERQFAPLEQAINFNLIGDAQIADIVHNPAAHVETKALAPSDEAEAAQEEDKTMANAVSYAAMMIFFFVFSMSSGFMLRSVSQEKENRTAEVLLLSLRPRELMLGKLIGLGAMGLLQVMIWIGGGLLLLNNRMGFIKALGTFQLPPMFLVWALLYFLAGYLLYGSAMGAIGALAPTMRETGSFTFIVMLPLMLPLWFNWALIQTPQGGLAVGLSLFPLTSPLAMMTRLAAGHVPLWQVLISLSVLAATTYALVLLSARFFRADTLLSGSELNWQRLVKEFKKA
jgi:ABC-2 type transport system permease protein